MKGWNLADMVRRQIKKGKLIISYITYYIKYWLHYIGI